MKDEEQTCDNCRLKSVHQQPINKNNHIVYASLIGCITTTFAFDFVEKLQKSMNLIVNATSQEFLLSVSNDLVNNVLPLRLLRQENNPENKHNPTAHHYQAKVSRAPGIEPGSPE